MYPRLVQHHMRELRQAVFHVLHAAVAHDVLRLFFVGLPEGHLVDPAGLLHHPLAEVEGLEHLHRAAGDAIGLTQLQRAVLLLDDAGVDVGKGRQLRGQRQPGGAAADDEHVHLRRCGVGVRGSQRAGVGHMGVTGLEAVQMELHGGPFSGLSACPLIAGAIVGTNRSSAET